MSLRIWVKSDIDRSATSPERASKATFTLLFGRKLDRPIRVREMLF